MLFTAKRLFNIWLVAVIVTLSSCVNLKHVSAFSKTSTDGLEHYEKLTVNFSEICFENGRQKSIGTFDIHNTDYNCAADQKADSITQVMYHAVRNYYTGLVDLSNNELTDYNTENFTKALTTGDFGPVQLTKTDVKAYSDISTLLLRAFTDGYRRKKVKEYVTLAHGPIVKLLHFLELNLEGNLYGKLEVQKSSLKNQYFDFIRDKKLSDYERTKFAEDYFEKVSEITSEQEELNNYAAVLREISEGHLTLYNNVGNMTDAQVRKALAMYNRQMNTTIGALRNF